MKYLDNLGVTISTICLIHCILLPILILFFPIISLYYIMNEAYEWIFLSLSIVIGFYSLCLGHKQHKSLSSLKILVFGFLFMFISKIFDDSNNDLYHTLFVLAGGILIIISHILNKKLCNACDRCKVIEN